MADRGDGKADKHAGPDGDDERLRSEASDAKSAPVRLRADQELMQTKEELRESHERLELALDVGNLGTWNWDAATDRLTLGPRAARMFGVAPGIPVTRARIRELLVPKDRQRSRKALDRALAERTDYNIEYQLIRPSGGQCWIAASGRGRSAADGTVLGMTGVVQDISARKRMDEALNDETHMLELLNQTGIVLASKLDLPPLLQAVTDAAVQLSGAQFGAFFHNTTDTALLDTLSGTPREAFERFGSPRVSALFGPTLRGEGTVRIDDLTQDPRYAAAAPRQGMRTGYPPLRSYIAVPVISRFGEVIGGLFLGHPDPGVFVERTERLIEGVAAQAGGTIDNARLYAATQKASEERKQLLESERAARTEAERMGEMKDEFLTTLSHELRTPLSAILGWAHALRRHTVSEADLHKGLDTIERNARVQTQLIEDLLDMSRITSGKLRLDTQPVDAVSFIEASVETARPAAEAKEITIEKLLDPEAGPILGDPNRLQQVVWNLLSNAIKFTPRGGKVQILLQRAESHVDISVSDTGAGIRPEFLSHVFERFRQADASITRKYGGLGLGLSIVKSLVELHGGTVSATSPGEGRGSTFTVHLPVIAVRYPNKYNEERLHSETAKLASLDYQNPDLSGIRVLVVDDQPDARELVKRVLSECDAQVLTADSAGEALELIARETPDVLVTDIGMPGMDGFELLRRVRELTPEKGAGIPAIALTAFARSEDRTRALRAGFQVHVSKPVEPAELVASIASAVGRTGGARNEPR